MIAGAINNHAAVVREAAGTVVAATNNHGAVVRQASGTVVAAIDNHEAVVREAAGTVVAAIDSHDAMVEKSAAGICDVLREGGRENRRALWEEGEKNRRALWEEGEKNRRALWDAADLIRFEIRNAATSPATRARSEVPDGTGNSMSPGKGVAHEGEPSTAERSLGTGGTGNTVPVDQGSRTAEGEERRPSELASTDSSGRTTAQKKRGKAAKRPQFPNDRPLFGNKSS
ncbi:hypothetical protein KC332_g1033 [Hortaea werneckii]|nr:hypothetical protein KC358_g8977 [Hortaea werneckii]KAI6848080.1 hypothetical protein KC350_g3144 [Hortaea werneckii]KAI6939230.1 hypothetical protein KC348_g5324 [Hortaea werneckii]KAI6943984.1 hypothetical protein KC341_g1126 [Hortaea werneckii]KAI6963497.1 hypothetical protein KC329_g15942 [Hortaea werneckii]